MFSFPLHLGLLKRRLLCVSPVVSLPTENPAGAFFVLVTEMTSAL